MISKRILTYSFLLILFALVISLYFNIHQYPLIFNENGLIESSSALGYLFCLFYMVTKWPMEWLKKYHYFLILTVFFGLRELDFDKKFTTMGIFKSRFYLSDIVPMAEKIAGLLVLAILAYALIAIFIKHIKNLNLNIIKSSTTHQGLISVFFIIIISKSIDGIGRKLSGFGVNLNDNLINNLNVIEEVLELGIPVLILSSLISIPTQQIRFNKQQKEKV